MAIYNFGRNIVVMGLQRSCKASSGEALENTDFWSWPMYNLPLANYIDFMDGNMSAHSAGFPATALPLSPNRTYLFDWPISECPDPTI